MRHRPEAEYHLDRSEHAGSVVHRAIDNTPSGVRAKNKRGRAVGIYMIRAVLCVIFQNKNRRLRPKARFRNGFHQQPKRIIVIRKAGKRPDFSG